MATLSAASRSLDFSSCVSLIRSSRPCSSNRRCSSSMMADFSMTSERAASNICVCCATSASNFLSRSCSSFAMPWNCHARFTVSPAAAKRASEFSASKAAIGPSSCGSHCKGTAIGAKSAHSQDGDAPSRSSRVCDLGGNRSVLVEEKSRSSSLSLGKIATPRLGNFFALAFDGRRGRSFISVLRLAYLGGQGGCTKPL